MMRERIKKLGKKFREYGPSEFLSRAVRYGVDSASKAVYRMIAVGIIATLEMAGRVTHVGATGTRKGEYGTTERVEVSIDGGDEPVEFEPYIRQWRAEMKTVHVLSDVRLIGSDGIVISKEGKVVLDGSCGSRFMLRRSIERLLRREGTIRTVTALIQGLTGYGAQDRVAGGKYSLSMVNPHANNYFHWTIEHLARLRGVETCSAIDRNDVEVLVSPIAPSFVSESLALLGWSTVAIPESDVVTVEWLIIPDHSLRSREHEFNVAPADLRWVRNQVHTATGSGEGSKPKRLFISRADANTRNMANDEEVMSLLSGFGFEAVVLTELSFAEQAQLFREAEVIVAPHGAGLANTLFASSATIVELYGRDLVQGRYFMMLAAELGHEYHVMQCETVGGDLFVPTDDLATVLTSIDAA